MGIFNYLKLNVHTLPKVFMTLRAAAVLLLIDILIGATGFVLLEGYSIPDAFFMVVITLSTVGYGEVHPLSPAGKVFTSVFIMMNIGLFAYFLAVFSYYVIQGEIFKSMYSNYISDHIGKLQDHIIICGYGKYGKEVSRHFLKHRIQFVIIDQDPAKVEMMQRAEETILYIQDDATHDEALVGAGVKRARGLISALPDDSDNLFIVLTARQLNPRIRLISRAKDPKSERKLLLAGANQVVMPEQIGGFYMATLITKPGAVDFFSFITNEYRSDIGFEEISYENIPAACRGKSIQDLHIRSSTGANIIGYRDAANHYHINPGPETVLFPGTSFIVLGDHQQLSALKAYLNSFPLQPGITAD